MTLARENVSGLHKNQAARSSVMEASSLATKGAVRTVLCIFLNPVTAVQLRYLPHLFVCPKNTH
jgi:hypothetical protein